MTVSQKGGQNCVPKGSAVKNNNILYTVLMVEIIFIFFLHLKKQEWKEINQYLRNLNFCIKKLGYKMLIGGDLI